MPRGETCDASRWMPLRIAQLEADNDDLRQRLRAAQAIADTASSERDIALEELARAKQALHAANLRCG